MSAALSAAFRVALKNVRLHHARVVSVALYVGVLGNTQAFTSSRDNFLVHASLGCVPSRRIIYDSLTLRSFEDGFRQVSCVPVPSSADTHASRASISSYVPNKLYSRRVPSKLPCWFEAFSFLFFKLCCLASILLAPLAMYVSSQRHITNFVFGCYTCRIWITSVISIPLQMGLFPSYNG